MSWSYVRRGLPEEVLPSMKKELAHYTCTEPEESIKQTVFDIVELACDKWPRDVEIEVSAHGSQSLNAENGMAINTLQLVIKQPT